MGQDAVSSVLGPLSPTLEGCKLFFKSVLDAKPWLLDPLALRMPWDEAAYQLRDHGEGKTPLCFALQWDNGDVKPNPPYIRAMRTVREALVAQGHKVVDWKLPFAAEQNQLLLQIFVSDGGMDIADNCALSGEPVIGGALAGRKLTHLTTQQFHQHINQCRQSAAKLLRAWQDTTALTGTGRPFDAVIAPTAPYPSFLPGQKQYIFYTGVSNFNDFPSSTFPVTTVQPAVDGQVEPHEFMSAEDKELYDRYDPEVCKDIPIGLQVIGQRGEDEAVFRMTEIVVDALEEVAVV